MDDQTRIELEAAAFRTLRAHLMEKRLSRWYQEAANEKGIEMSKYEAREIFYGMSMDEWKAQYQTDANDVQKADFQKAFDENVKK